MSMILGAGAVADNPAFIPLSQWIGIPDPKATFTYDPINVVEPADPGGWPAAEVINYYYIDPSHGSATDTANTYGYPDKPRLTIPSTLSLAASGGKAVIVGDGNSYTAATDITVSGNGDTSDQNWIVGRFSTNRPVLDNYRFDIDGIYSLFEEIDIINYNESTHGPSSVLNVDAEFVTVRECEFGGDGVDHGNGTATSCVSNGCFYNVRVHDFGDWQAAAAENDYHGFKISLSSAFQNIWLLNFNADHLGGDSIQIGSAGGAFGQGPSFVYIGGGVGFMNKENHIDIKTSHDIIISQTRGHDFVTSASSSGEGYVIHDKAEDIWVIACEADVCAIGMSVSSGPRNVYILHNRIHDCQTNNGRGISKTTSGVVTIVSNTFWDNKVSVRLAGQNTVVASNAFGPKLLAADYDVTFGSTSDENGSIVDKNAYEDCNCKISTTDYDFTGWQGQGYEVNGAEGNLDFDDIGADDVHIGVSSICVDLAERDALFATFLTKYGIDIEVDYDKVARPSISGDWDAGCFEKVA